MDYILSQLESVRKSGKGYTASCPAHDDRIPSLSVTQADDGRILLCCHAGCCTKDICAALGISLGDLFPDSRVKGERIKYRALKKQRDTFNKFNEMRHQAFLAMVEFRDLAELVYKEEKLDIPDDMVATIHKLPMLNHYLLILAAGSDAEVLELLETGVIHRWRRLYNSRLNRNCL